MKAINFLSLMKKINPLRDLAKFFDESRISYQFNLLVWKFKYIVNANKYTPKFEQLIKMPHRKLLVEIIMNYKNWNSCLEIGCGKAPNLFLLSQKDNKKNLYGADISQSVINQNKKNILLKKINFFQSSLFAVADKNYDIILSDAVLMYSPPSKIKSTLEKLIMAAKSIIIINTFHIKTIENNEPWIYLGGSWAYDFEKLLIDIPCKYSIKKHPENLYSDHNWIKYGHIITITKVKK